MAENPPEFTILNGGRFISRGIDRHPVRTIDSDELIFVVSGKLAIYEENTTFTVNPGEWLVLRRGREHGGLEKYPGNLSFYWLHFVDESGFLESLPSHGRAVRQERLTSYCQNFISVQQEKKCEREELELLFRLMFHELRRSESLQSGKGCGSALVLAAKQMIELRFRENLTPEVIGRELHCNSEYVGRMFKREYGRTITAAVNTMRVEYAAKLLAATSYSVKEIVVMSGFNDPAYFRRCFYKRYALTPVRFRMRWVQGHFNSC